MFANGDKINYAEACQLLVIDLEQAGLDEKQWTVQRPKPVAADAASKITAKALNRLADETSQAPSIALSVKSQVKSIAPSKQSSQTARKLEIQNSQFPIKNDLDFPDYRVQDGKTRFVPNEKPPMPEQTKMNYYIELLGNDRDLFDQL